MAVWTSANALHIRADRPAEAWVVGLSGASRARFAGRSRRDEIRPSRGSLSCPDSDQTIRYGYGTKRCLSNVRGMPLFLLEESRASLLFVDMFLNIHTRNQLVSRKCLSLSYPDVNAYNMTVI